MNEVTSDTLAPDEFPSTWIPPLGARDLLRAFGHRLPPTLYLDIQNWIVVKMVEGGWTKQAISDYYKIQEDNK